MSTQNTPLISLNNVTAGYNGKPALRDVNFDIYPKDFIGIIGPNGGGKTTLIKVMLGLLKPFQGTIKTSLNNAETLGSLSSSADS